MLLGFVEVSLEVANGKKGYRKRENCSQCAITFPPLTVRARILFKKPEVVHLFTQRE